MKRVRYTKFTGDLASEMDIEDLLKALSDYLLDSGFRDPYLRFQEMDHTLDDLREALRQLLESGDMFDERIRQQLEQMGEQGKLDDLIDKLIQRMEQENYISYSQNMSPITDVADDGAGGQCPGRSQIRSHGQEPRLSRLQDPARSARVRWVNRASAVTTRATGPRASKPRRIAEI